MIVIRLQRVGKKNQPSYRVVLAEKTAPVKGRFLEILGNYNPRLKTRAFEKDRILHWLSKGAQASPTVHNLLVAEKIINSPKVKAWTSKKKEGKKTSGESVVAPAEKSVEVAQAEAKVEEKSAEQQGIAVEGEKEEAKKAEEKAE